MQAQEPVFKNYGVADGLPSSEVYYAMQDSKGFMWFCTDGGVSRFDGYTFETFTIADGLCDNVVFSAFEDHKGRIWFRTFSGKLSYYFNDSIHSIAANKILNSSFGYSFTTSLYVDKSDTIWCGTRYNKGYYKIAPNYGVNDVKMMEAISSPGFYVFAKDSAMVWGAVSSNKSTNMYVKMPGEQLIQWCCISDELQALVYCKNKKLLFAYHEKLVQYEKGVFKGIPHFFPGKIVSLVEDQRSNVWIGMIKKGVCVFKGGDFSSKPIYYLNDYSVSSVFIDNEGGSWFTTLEKGIFYTPSRDFLNYTANNGLTTEKVVLVSKVTDQNKILFSGERGEIHLLKEEDDHVSPVAVANTISTFMPRNDNYTAVSRYGHLLYFYASHANKVIKYRITDKNKSFIKSYFYDGKEQISLTSPSTFTTANIFEQGSEVITPLNLRVHCIHVDNNNVTWFGTGNGLWNYENKQFNNAGIKYPLLSKRIEDIKVGVDGTWWLATKGEGVIIKRADAFIHIGISKVKMKSWGTYTIENFSTSDGLLSNEVNMITRCGNRLYAATNSGVTAFNPNALIKNITPPLIHINKFTVNSSGLKYTVDSTYSLTYKQNFITVNFVGISYHKIGKLTYKYRLKGLDTTWHFTKNTSVQYTSLSPSAYTFEVLAVTDDAIQSVKPATLLFAIGKPFWLKWWFITLVVLIVLLVIIVIYNLRINTIKKTESEKTRINKQIADIELKALRAQMNPHFIFNSINSIQHFILDNDRLSAQKYLAKFARLIRNVMENSKYEYILLTQELQTLKLYIELEILRSSFSFTYELIIDENLFLEKIAIPPMVLQPYIENAILHGIMPLTGKNGVIRIKIEKNTDALKCTIDDNGIGRKQAQEYKNKKKELHKSMGLSITKERLDILNQTSANKLSINIIDKYDTSGIAKGTTIELFIPIK
jgi:ligand-binding sensor domain-containing protein